MAGGPKYFAPPIALGLRRTRYLVRAGEGFSLTEKFVRVFLYWSWSAYITLEPPSIVSRGCPFPEQAAEEDVAMVFWVQEKRFQLDVSKQGKGDKFE